MLIMFYEVFRKWSLAVTRQGQSYCKAKAFEGNIRQAKICVSRTASFMIRQGLERKETTAGPTVCYFSSLMVMARKLKAFVFNLHFNKKVTRVAMI